jgi:hypothetical protein
MKHLLVVGAPGYAIRVAVEMSKGLFLPLKRLPRDDGLLRLVNEADDFNRIDPGLVKRINNERRLVAEEFMAKVDESSVIEGSQLLLCDNIIKKNVVLAVTPEAWAVRLPKKNGKLNIPTQEECHIQRLIQFCNNDLARFYNYDDLYEYRGGPLDVYIEHISFRLQKHSRSISTSFALAEDD